MRRGAISIFPATRHARVSRLSKEPGAVQTRGLGNVATRGLDIAGIDLEADRWDAVISRRALMFTPDLAAALVGARRALRASERESRWRRSQLGSPRPTPWAEARRDRVVDA